MTSIRVVFPKLRLAKLLQSPGGLPVAEALEQAQQNLQEISPDCAAELAALLEQCEALCLRLTDEYDEALLREIYAAAVKGIGAGEIGGLPAIDAALTSFCDLLDHLSIAKRQDREAVDVHIRAWRLLMNTGLIDADRDRILGGLLKVSGRYAAETEAAGRCSLG